VFSRQQLSVFVSLFAASVFIGLTQICDLAWQSPEGGGVGRVHRRPLGGGAMLSVLQVTEGGWA
jgi:hypothetical protein